MDLEITKKNDCRFKITQTCLNNFTFKAKKLGLFLKSCPDMSKLTTHTSSILIWFNALFLHKCLIVRELIAEFIVKLSTRFSSPIIDKRVLLRNKTERFFKKLIINEIFVWKKIPVFLVDMLEPNGKRKAGVEYRPTWCTRVNET